MANQLDKLVAGALTNVSNPRTGSDVISSGQIQELSVSGGGEVTFVFLLGRDDPPTLVRETRAAVRAVKGVSSVKVQVREPGGAPSAPGPSSQAVSPPSPPSPVDLPGVGHVIAISSGKGGVGKSTVSSNLAVQLAKEGKLVGLMDADVYGPNLPRMFGVNEKPPIDAGKIIPLEAHGVKLMSLGFMIEREAPSIWRGPIIMKIIQQFLRDVEWGQLDYLLVDLPPGTGDAQLSLVQAVQVKGAIIVTTPQEVAIGDALRGVKMFEKVGVPVLGIVENMSFFSCPHCKERTEIFMSGGGERLAAEVDVPLLARIPLQAGMADRADAGQPIVLAAPDSPAAVAFQQIATEVQAKAGARKTRLPIVS